MKLTDKETIKKLIDIGFSGDLSLSHIIDWIRINKNFNIWIEHGVTNKNGKTHDVTTSYGCHRGSYKTYEDAQLEGIDIFLRNLWETHINIELGDGISDMVNLFKELGFSFDNNSPKSEHFYMYKYNPYIDVQGDNKRITLRLIGTKDIEEEERFESSDKQGIINKIKEWEEYYQK